MVTFVAPGKKLQPDFCLPVHLTDFSRESQSLRVFSHVSVSNPFH